MIGLWICAAWAATGVQGLQHGWAGWQDAVLTVQWQGRTHQPTLPGPVHGLWHDGEQLYVALREQTQPRLFRVDLVTGEAEGIADWVLAMAADPGGGWLVASPDGSLSHHEGFVRTESGWSPRDLRLLGRADPLTAVDGIGRLGAGHIWVATPSRWYVASEPVETEEGLTFDIQRMELPASLPGVTHRSVLRVSPTRWLWVEHSASHARVHRVSALSSTVPWTVPLGAVDLPSPVLGGAASENGALLATDASWGRDLLPGVSAASVPPGTIAVGVDHQGSPITWNGRDAPQSWTALPRAPHRVPGEAAITAGDWTAWRDAQPDAGPLGTALWQEDLPLGLGRPPSPVRFPDLTRESPLRLDVLWIYLQGGWVAESLASRTVARQQFWRRAPLALAALLALAGSTLFLGMMNARLLRRRRQRDRVLTAGYNPLSQDSPNDPAKPPFDSRALCSDVLAALDLNYVVIQGPPLYGKSSVLSHLAWRLTHEGLAGRPATVVRVRLDGVAEADFWDAVGRPLARSLAPHPVAAEVLEEPVLDRDVVEYLLDEALPEDVRVVLILDDLDQLGSYGRESQRFRGLIQLTPAHRLTVLGAAEDLRRGLGGGADESPWYNLFQVRYLQAFTADALFDWLSRRLVAPRSVTRAAAERIHALTEGRPMQAWQLAFAAVQHLDDTRTFRLDAPAVDVVARDLHAQAGHYTAVAIDEDLALLGSSEEVWEALLPHIASARKRRAVLRAQLDARLQAVEDSAAGAFFQE